MRTASYLTPQSRRGYFTLPTSNPCNDKTNPGEGRMHEAMDPRLLRDVGVVDATGDPPPRATTQDGLTAVSSVIRKGDEPFGVEGSLSMKGSGGTPMSVAHFRAELAKASEKLYAVSGDERLLARLPRGNWVGGTIPYLMTDEQGGLTTRDSVLVQELLTDERALPNISVYDKQTIARITADAPANGYTFLMIPAFSDVHLVYGKEAPPFKDIFGHPIVGWISGIH